MNHKAHNHMAPTHFVEQARRAALLASGVGQPGEPQPLSCAESPGRWHQYRALLAECARSQPCLIALQDSEHTLLPPLDQELDETLATLLWLALPGTPEAGAAEINIANLTDHNGNRQFRLALSCRGNPLRKILRAALYQGMHPVEDPGLRAGLGYHEATAVLARRGGRLDIEDCGDGSCRIVVSLPLAEDQGGWPVTHRTPELPH